MDQLQPQTTANKQQQHQKTKWWEVALFVFFVLLVIIVFVISFGQYNLADDKEVAGKTREERRAQAEKLNKQYEAELLQHLTLKAQLERKISRIMFAIRLLLVLLWAGISGLFIWLKCIKNLEDFLNYSQALLLGYAVLVFLIRGNITDIPKIVGDIRTYVENRVYRDYGHLDAEIERAEAALVQVQATQRDAQGT